MWNGVLDLLVRYYGIDWVATVITLGSIYSLGSGRRLGFTLGGVGAIFWIVVNVLASSVAGVLLNALLLFLFLRGFLKWSGRGARVSDSAA